MRGNKAAPDGRYRLVRRDSAGPDCWLLESEHTPESLPSLDHAEVGMSACVCVYVCVCACVFSRVYVSSCVRVLALVCLIRLALSYSSLPILQPLYRSIRTYARHRAA